MERYDSAAEQAVREWLALTKELPGAPDGEYIVFEFATRFAHEQNAVEIVTPMRDVDGQWRVSGYFVR